MNKKIKNIAKIVLNDFEYSKLNELLKNKKLNSARIYIESLINEIEDILEFTENYSERSQLIENLNKLDTILDEIFNLYEEEDEGEQIKQSVG
jgi:ribosome-interacting GTPase 1